jgi:hypothetical protein
LQDALPSVGHAVDFIPAEEDAQLAPLHSFERGEVLLDALDEFGDVAFRVVPPRIGNEQVEALRRLFPPEQTVDNW